MGLDGLLKVFPCLGKEPYAHVTPRIGKPFGPCRAMSRGRVRRKQLAAIGHRIMEHITEPISAERRGHYSDDPDMRAAAHGTQIHPWGNAPDYLWLTPGHRLRRLRQVAMLQAMTKKTRAACGEAARVQFLAKKR